MLSLERAPDETPLAGPPPRRRRAALLIPLLVVFAVSATAFAALSWKYLSNERQRVQGSLRSAEAHGTQGARAIDGRLKAAMKIADDLAADLNRGAFTSDDAQLRARLAERLDARLLDTLKRNPGLGGIGVAFEPYAYSPARRLYAPYFERLSRGEPRHLQIGDQYDYTAYQYRWYGDPLLEGPMWHEPFFGRATRTMLVPYCVPFYRPGPRREDDAPIGIVAVMLSLREIGRMVESLNLGETGYAFLFSREGQYVNHPRRDLVRSEATVFETAWADGDTELNSVAIAGVQGRQGRVAAFDHLTGRSSWIFYHPVPSSGWTLASVVFRDEHEADPDEVRHNLAAMVLSGLIAAATAGLALLTLLYRGQKGVLWAGTGLVSVLLAAGILLLWSFALAHPSDLEGSTAAYDRAGVERHLGDYDEQARAQGSPPARRVPTGVFVKSIDFQSSTNVAVTGYVWQRYRKGEHDGLTRGFTLPEADEPTIEKLYDRDRGDEQVIGWSFSANLRQHFAYDRYPLDQQDVWLRLKHADLDGNAILVPDFDAYRLMDPRSRPGLDRDLVLPGWDVEESYFDFRPHRYNTNFGLDGFPALRDTPELYFNVDLRRQVLGPFVSHVVPILVVAAMLFAILVLSSPSTPSSLFGFTAMDVVLGCSALFFVVIFDHISLRESLASSTVMYFEYFYFLTYLALMLVVVNAILFAADRPIALVRFADNLLPKLVYWPSYLAGLFLFTYVILR